MPTKLTDSNIKSVKATVKNKGFRTKFWREYRSSTCKGLGIGKAMDRLQSLGVSEGGSPKSCKFEDLDEVIGLFDTLGNAFSRGISKCGKFQKHTQELCFEYNRWVNKRHTEAEELLRSGESSALMKGVVEDRKEMKRKEREEAIRKREEEKRSAQEVAKKKKGVEEELVKKVKKEETPEYKAEVRDKVQYTIKLLKEIPPECSKVSNNAKKGIEEIKSIMSNWSTGRDSPKVDKNKLDKAVMTAVQGTAKTHDLTKAKDMLMALDKHKGGALDYIKGLTLRGQDGALTKDLKKATETATKAISNTATVYKAYVADMQKAFDTVNRVRASGSEQV